MLESGVQLFSRINSSSSRFGLNDINAKLFEEGAPRPNEAIEVIGDSSRDLLVDFLVRCILPNELNPEWKGSGVVFLNTTQQISIIKIGTVMDLHLKRLKVEKRKAIIEKALGLITILNCYNSEQFEVTVKCLDKIIEERENVNLLVIDDIISQYWIAKEQNLKLSFDQFCKQNLQMIQDVVKNLNIVLIFSRSQISSQRLDLNVDYRIEMDNTQCIVTDYVKKTTNSVSYKLEKFITF